MVADLLVHRFSNAEYLRMVESGLLGEQPVELLDGCLVDVSPQGPEHGYVIQALTVFLGARADLLRVQLSLETQQGWVPEPDLALVEGRERDRHPASAWLVVEVAVSQQREAHLKAATYARAGIPRYWIVDIPAAAVIEHTDPMRDGYTTVRTLRGDDALDLRVEGIAPTTVARLLA